MIKIKKYKYGGLSIEITRRCNKHCDHCSKGDTQNITITKEIVNRIFQNVSDCEMVCITGGETTLELNMLEYLVDCIIKSDWDTKILQLTTNGVIKDRQLVDIFGRFCNSGQDRKAYIRISNDMFHSREEYEPAMKFYKDMAETVSKHIFVIYTGSIISLKYEGRAKKYIDEHPEYCTPFSCVATFPCINRRVKIEDDFIPCILAIGANGNFGFEDDSSYKRFDDLAFGNILSNSMADLIDRNNDNCLLTCAENESYNVANSWRFWNHAIYDTDSSLSLKIYQLFIERIIFIRKWAKENFPCLATQDIIEHIPIAPLYKTDSEEAREQFFDELITLIKTIYLMTQYKEIQSKKDSTIFENIISSLNNFVSEKSDPEWEKEFALKHIDDETKTFFLNEISKTKDPEEESYYYFLLFVIALLNNANENDPMYPRLFLPGFVGDKWHILTHSEAFKVLDELNSDYSFSSQKPDNSKNFPCDPE